MINSTLCYIENNNKYLMLYRNKKENDPNEGKWIGIGGKTEQNESPEQCLLREVYEETGLTLLSYEYIGKILFISDSAPSEKMYLYKGTSFSGVLNTSCNEGTLKWVNTEDILSLPTWEGDKYFLLPLLSGKTGLDIELRYNHEKLIEVIDRTKALI